MAKIIDGKELARKIREDLKEEVAKLKNDGIFPKLAVIMVGDDKASKTYVKNKSKACEEIGIAFEEFILDENTTMEELLGLIDKLNNRDDINGILLQSPIPKNLDIIKAFDAIDYRKDVDGFNPVNVGKLSIGEDCFISCTPLGIVRMLEEYKIDVEGKNIYLTIDANLQFKLEKIAQNAIEQTHAASLMMVAAEAKTGEIISYISLPSADLNEYSKATPAQMKDLPATESYEPGSVFKIFSLLKHQIIWCLIF